MSIKTAPGFRVVRAGPYHLTTLVCSFEDETKAARFSHYAKKCWQLEGFVQGIRLALKELAATDPDEPVSVGWLVDKLESARVSALQDLSRMGEGFTPEERATFRTTGERDS